MKTPPKDLTAEGIFGTPGADEPIDAEDAEKLPAEMFAPPGKNPSAEKPVRSRSGRGSR